MARREALPRSAGAKGEGRLLNTFRKTKGVRPEEIIPFDQDEKGKFQDF